MEGFIPVFAIFAVFGSLVAIVVGPSWLKSRERREVQQTVRVALEKGQPLPAEVIDALSKDIVKNLPSRSKDLRRGVLTLSAAVGLALMAQAMGMQENDVVYPLLGVAAIPAMIGLAFIVLSFFNPNKD